MSWASARDWKERDSNLPLSSPAREGLRGKALEGELVRVVKTLEELQHKYLALLDDESAREDPVETLNDYKVLSEKMLGWIEECDNMTR